jgi:hypothetical protein
MNNKNTILEKWSKKYKRSIDCSSPKDSVREHIAQECENEKVVVKLNQDQ